MRYWIGFDVGKEAHWVIALDGEALDGEGVEDFSGKVETTETDLETVL